MQIYLQYSTNGEGNGFSTTMANILVICQKMSHTFKYSHNLRFIGQADWVIDMGPGAGDNGGKVLFEGLPFELMNHYQTNTSIAMQKYFLNNSYTE